MSQKMQQEKDSYIPTFSINDFVDSKCHFGHRSKLRSHDMSEYILGTKNGIDIVDVSKSFYMFSSVLDFLFKASKSNKKILFLKTSSDNNSHLIEKMATKSGQHYMTKKWIGGTLTNHYNTIIRSIRTLESYNKKLENPSSFVTKKERSIVQKKADRLNSILSGVMNMNRIPDILFVFDPKKDIIAIEEASSLGITVIAICDTNSKLNGIDLFFSGNNIGNQSIAFYCEHIYNAILSGTRTQMKSSGINLENIITNPKE